jgi:tryptophan synthase alpha chain
MIASNLKYNRLNRKFQELSLKNQCALSCYIVAGYPSESWTEEIASNLVEAGVDIIEIGIPFSDPIADGPTIQEASNAALLNGITPGKCFKICSNIRRKFPDLPLVIMTYSNIVFRAGLEDFIIRSKKCGIDGFILPDMTVEESRTYVDKASALGLATIFLVSPNTDKDRLNQILNMSSGFLYVVSVFGITGVSTHWRL